jgi:aminoglycoside phosphotransferase family enzyme
MMHLAEKVDFLSDPASYAGATRHVEAQETHMAWVFLTDDRVYKLKKPVKYPFLDFSSLKRRHFYCREELRLNRRLAQPTYLAVVALRLDERGRLTLSGEGRVVDWLVEMRRLPAAEMLDNRIRQGRVTREEIERVGALLVDFYSRRSQERVAGDAYLRHLIEEHAVNRAILARPEFSLLAMAERTLDKVEDALARFRPVIEDRILQGRIVEGHGDLRPEHVCLTDPPQIIDCLEFNRAMRIIDPYDEVNYLGLECEIHGAAWIRPLLSSILEKQLGGAPSAALLALYGGFRGLLRARLCVVHLLETPLRHPETWHPLAIRYLAAAEKLCVSLPAPAGRRSTRVYGDA